MATYRWRMRQHTLQRPSLTAAKACALHSNGLTVRDRVDVLVPSTDLFIPRGSVTLVHGGTPTARLLLAHAIAGRLPEERLTTEGELTLFGATSTRELRNHAVLALPWCATEGSTPLEHRISSLRWAFGIAKSRRQSSHQLLVLSPALDGLGSIDESVELIAEADQITRGGTTVMLTASSRWLDFLRSNNLFEARDHEATGDTITATSL